MEGLIAENQGLKEQLRQQKGGTEEERREEEQNESELEGEYRQFRVVAGRAFDKLKFLLREYIPCSKLYGFDEYGLDTEERILLHDCNSKDEQQRCLEELKTANSSLS